jgi:ATP adenylyltransferase/5',5'''-P-1,P-4-tetraphosphate phosphorylase II
MIVLGHVVISSAVRSASQGDPLDLSDCDALAQVWRGFGERGLLYYNAGVLSGCSQLHKHMQFAPLSECPLIDAMGRGEKLPYRYYAEKVDAKDGEAILSVYEQLRKVADWNGDYNFVISNGIAALVPRREPIYKGLIVNGIGVAGHLMLWVGQNHSAETEPLDILVGACVPW